MANQFYQPTYEKDRFNYSDDLYKQDALNIQKGELQQRKNKQAWDNLGDMEFKPPFSRDSQILGGSTSVALNRAMEVANMPDGAEKRAEMAKVQRAINQNRVLTNQSSELDKSYGVSNAIYINPNNKLTGESRQNFTNAQDPSFWNDKNVVTDEYGYSTINGVPLEQYSFWGRDNVPKLETYAESAFLAAIKTQMPEGIFDKDANGNIIYDDARNKETSLMLAQEFFTNGTINQDEVDELARKIYVHRRAQSSYKKDDSNNSGNDDDKFSPIRKAGIVPIPKSEGVEGGIRGINYKATATQVLSDDGRKAIPTGFHVTKDGHVMITAVQPNEKIIAAATEGDGGVMEIMINNAEKMDPFRYDPNKHSGFLSTIQKAWDKPLTEAELAKLINEYNDSATGVSNELKKDDSKSKEKEEDKKTIIW